jgi:hypothetical protein
MKNLKKVLPEAEMKLKLAIDFIEKKQKDKNENDEDYLFTTNVNRSLSKVLEIDYIKDFLISDYEPPKEHGLLNCNIIKDFYNLKRLGHLIFLIIDVKNFLISIELF